MIPNNQLAHLKDFQHILENYKPNIEVIDLLNQIKLVLLVAPAASGRNTIIRNIIMTGKYYFLVSDTTRKPRVNNGVPERNGEEYWFRTEQEMLDGLRRGEYMEAAIIHEQQVSGTSIQELRNAVGLHKVAVTDIDIVGASQIREFTDVDCVFVIPPDFDEWMRRMDSRGAMDRDEKKRRLRSAIQEISRALSEDYFKFLVNWDVRKTSEELHEQVINSLYDEVTQDYARHHAIALLARLDSEL